MALDAEARGVVAFGQQRQTLVFVQTLLVVLAASLDTCRFGEHSGKAKVLQNVSNSERQTTQLPGCASVKYGWSLWQRVRVLLDAVRHSISVTQSTQRPVLP